VIATEVRDEHTMALRRFNDHVTADERTVSMILPVGDGVTLIRHA
jgi:predicted O-methyltransferase YrrM